VLAPFFVEARHPDRFLIELYDLSPEVVVHSLHAQAETISRSLQELLGTCAAWRQGSLTLSPATWRFDAIQSSGFWSQDRAAARVVHSPYEK